MSEPFVYCVGELMWDLHAEPDRRLADSPRLMRVAGGAAFNVAQHLLESGVPSAVGGRVSDDAMGLALIDTMRDSGVKTDLMTTGPGRTGMVFIEHAGHGDDAVVSYRPRFATPAEPLLGAEQLERGQISLFFIGALVPCPEQTAALRDFAMRAAGADVPVVIDLNTRPAAWRGEHVGVTHALSLLAQARLIKASRFDLKQLGFDDPDRFAKQLGEDTVCIVTDGTEPIRVYGAAGRARLEVARVDNVFSVGAGDAFCAGLIAFVLRHGWPRSLQDVEQLVENGAAAARKHLRSSARQLRSFWP